MSPLVSILIPTFDRPHYLSEAIESAFGQTYSNLEILVFDNGTLDETLRVARNAAQRDARVRFHRNERNLGMSKNFNALAGAARGEFAVAIGDDDRLLPEFVEQLVAVMRPPVRVAFSNQFLINAAGQRLAERSKLHARLYGREALNPGLVADPNRAAWQLSIPMSASLLHTADLRRLRFREDLNTPDTEFFIRLAREGAMFCFVPEYLMEYRVHPGAETATGLWSEQLVECLTSYPVTPDIEPYKREFLAPMVVNAVSRCLQRGRMEQARSLLQNKYYPRRPAKSRNGAGPLPNPTQAGLRQVFSGLLQSFCAHLPPSLGAPFYRAVRRIRLASKGRVE